VSYLDRIAECHRWEPDDYRPFIIDDTALGRVPADMATRLADFPNVFQVSGRAVSLVPDLGTVAERTAAVADVLGRMREAGDITRWRDEAYPILRRWGEAPLLTMERAAVPLFGLRAFGVHLNGYVRDADGLRLWVARRAKNKATAPGKLDHLAAGGQPHGIGVKANLIKECQEEAGMAPDLAARAVSVGLVSYRCVREEGLRDDVLFCFDLELPAGFTPRNTDGEVDSFELWPFSHVLETIRDSDAFKFNVSLVILDFAIRHGFLQPDDPDYEEIAAGLRLPLDAA
jgi:isopentenyldiphosphate isomerase